ncbi:MAG TPA: pyridoxamine 5'-phosphate oxidase family protein [Nevskia sp.]|nr:pyridoxamine 5'-phosphate oxidase family protein [Nevskia sp.]
MSETPRQNPPGPSPWHAGEVALQRRAGVAERMEQIGRQVLRNHLNEQHRLFYPQLPFVALGAVDAQGEAWATLRAGQPGFLRAPDPSALHIALPRDPADPAETGMDDGQPLALLGIELHTRRRNRLNGSIRRGGGTGFDLLVQQSYGNCPRYIQLRDFSFARDPAVATTQPPVELPRLDARARAMIAGADTFFVATYASGADGRRQVDVSHRGGKPGFVRIDADGALTIPDFNGNLFFNTLGNILATGRAGLVFVDFASGDLLQLSGGAELLADPPELAAFEGAERLWRFTPRRVVHRADALPLRWSFREGGWSPFVLATGGWPAQEPRPGR